MINKNSLITGGLNGIGKCIAETLKNRGDKVFVFDYVDENDEKVSELKKLDIEYIQTNISSVESVKAGFEKLFEKLGLENLDILVNNAGIARDSISIRMSEEQWNSVINVNLKGTFFCSQQALKKMIRQTKSYILNISSIVGISGNPGQANYAASKGGIISLTKTLAKEYASRNILINAIAPGFIQTQLTDKLPEKFKNLALEKIPLKRFGQPQDIANLILFLTSGLSDYITGQIIKVDGGILI